MFKKFKGIKVAVFSAAAFFTIGAAAQAQSTHTVENDESLWSIAKDYGVAVEELKSLNNTSSAAVNPGEQITVPQSISENEKDLLARVVHSEAKGEPYAGKVAVATVVLNRVESDEFPNTINDVVYEVSPTGNYAFEPVTNGSINNPADSEARKAVQEALAFEGQGNGSLFFYNPATASNHWIATREETIQIGDHVFAK
ncbi:cell wall hydrolase [Thalassorhabdus alkalitolerans]|uniref:Cell wall hydrolase n=1 Tax=Thalassorhabdus alkalitolerans TaxID=2282697 RepID=A0ABW0YPG5_9BACI